MFVILCINLRNIIGSRFINSTRKMYVSILFLATAALALPAKEDIDPTVLCQVFGCPGDSSFTKPTPASIPDRIKPEDITVKPTEGTSTFTDKNGQQCTCVPYYLCNNELVAIDANNRSVTGWGELDIRFGESDNQCQESVERCCTNPTSPGEIPTVVPPPRPQGCGYRNPQGLDFTIKGGAGNEALFGEFPWVVALLDARNNSYAGVGVLIHPQVVMTGAHIATKYQDGYLMARAGEWDTQTTKERLVHEQRVAVTILPHPEYRKKGLWNDVALLKLDVPVNLNEHINVICLPNQDENFGNTRNCVANGWGKDVFGLQGRYAVILKKVEQDMVPNGRCETLLKRTRLGHNFRLHNSFVCSGGEEGKDTCQGDGGAPLACPIGNNRYKLSGLVAWGIGCGLKDVPGVSANVAKFRYWIDDVMRSWGFDTSVYNVN